MLDQSNTMICHAWTAIRLTLALAQLLPSAMLRAFIWGWASHNCIADFGTMSGKHAVLS